jgi:hypothetical protein
MAKRLEKNPLSEVAQNQAKRIARGTQRPGQTKEQTKLIEQGIQKGIELYKKQQSAKARELDKKLKKAKQQLTAPEVQGIEVQEKPVCKQRWLPWALLAVSWLAMAAYWLVD